MAMVIPSSYVLVIDFVVVVVFFRCLVILEIVRRVSVCGLLPSVLVLVPVSVLGVSIRANRVWARYFVTCAICRGSFSRQGISATFCKECNCYVCGTCDCTVFHLAYQVTIQADDEDGIGYAALRQKKYDSTAVANHVAVQGALLLLLSNDHRASRRWQ